MRDTGRAVSAFVAYQQQQQQQGEEQQQPKQQQLQPSEPKKKRKAKKQQQQQQEKKPESQQMPKKSKKSKKRKNKQQQQQEQQQQEQQQQQQQEQPPQKKRRAEAANATGARTSSGSTSSASSASISAFVDSAPIDPVLEAEEVFKELISPLAPKDFYSAYWEKKPLLIQRPGEREHYSDWFSTEAMDQMLRTGRVMFGEHLDVTSYRDGQRQTHNPDGRALASQVWDFYRQGCSLRLLCPQVFNERVYQKLSILHEHFGSFAGANVYLTPPGTQGFAPHWDDIEAFILQLEGSKHWRVYRPRSPAERLPRHSSGNFGPKDQLGHPIVDTVLRPGDLLYLPRGHIHQGRCRPDEHSLHITVSTYQRFAWADYLQQALGDALERAANEDVEFRRGLPLGFLSTFGQSYAAGDAGAAGRRQAEEHCRSLLARLSAHLDMDSAADRLGLQQVQDALPPALDPSEEANSAYEGGARWLGGRLEPDTAKLTPRSRIRLVRRSAVRLVDDRLHYSLDNTRVFREVDSVFLDVDRSMLGAVASLIAAYPAGVAVSDLPLRSLDEQMELANCLFERGLVVLLD